MKMKISGRTGKDIGLLNACMYAYAYTDVVVEVVVAIAITCTCRVAAGGRCM